MQRRLHVEIQHELVQMRAHAHGIDFVLTLVGDVGLQHVAGEDVAFQQELVIRLQCAVRADTTSSAAVGGAYRTKYAVRKRSGTCPICLRRLQRNARGTATTVRARTAWHITTLISGVSVATRSGSGATATKRAARGAEMLWLCPVRLADRSLFLPTLDENPPPRIISLPASELSGPPDTAASLVPRS